MNQIREDLDNRIGERLRLWMRDSEALFEAGNLRPRTAIEAIIGHLMTGCTMAIARWMPPKVDQDFVDAFGRMLREARKALKEGSKS